MVDLPNFRKPEPWQICAQRMQKTACLGMTGATTP